MRKLIRRAEIQTEDMTDLVESDFGSFPSLSSCATVIILERFYKIYPIHINRKAYYAAWRLFVVAYHSSWKGIGGLISYFNFGVSMHANVVFSLININESSGN